MSNQNIDYKIKKYTSKLKHSNDFEQAEVYKNKLDFYHKFNQSGGGAEEHKHKATAALEALKNKLGQDVNIKDKIEALEATVNNYKKKLIELISENKLYANTLDELLNQMGDIKPGEVDLGGIDDLATSLAESLVRLDTDEQKPAADEQKPVPEPEPEEEPEEKPKDEDDDQNNDDQNNDE